MDTLTRTRTWDTDSRVQDYLNDKLQTAADLEGIDALLRDVQRQHELLKKQVWIPEKDPKKKERRSS